MSQFTDLRDRLVGGARPQDLVDSVVIETRWLPPITLDKPLQGGGKPNPLVSFLKPRVTITTSWHDPITSAPYGEPGVNHWPQVKVGLIGIGALLGGFVLWQVVKK